MITGATGGLGKAFCKALVLTDNLFLTGRSDEKLLALKEELLKINKDAKIEVFSANLTSVEERKKLFEFIESKYTEIEENYIDKAIFADEFCNRHSEKN